ncbi:MAG: hypothetical protein ACRDS0_39280 [Pseudonocardiaceae bacterium]
MPQYDTTLEAVCTIDFITGEVRYDVNGARTEGVFRISPDYDPDKVDPDTPCVKVSFGDKAPDEPRYFGWSGYFKRPNRPTINGSVKLVGWARIDTDQINERPTPYSLDVHVFRQVGNREQDFTHAPDRTNERVTAIMVALVRHWVSLPGNAEIRLTAARHMLSTGDHIERKQQQIKELRADIDQREARLMRLCDKRDAMCRLLKAPAELIAVPVLAR